MRKIPLMYMYACWSYHYYTNLHTRISSTVHVLLYMNVDLKQSFFHEKEQKPTICNFFAGGKQKSPFVI